MIRPYLTVFADSFSEALASRVLWILLAISTLVLLSLAPLGLAEQQASRLRPIDVRDWPAFLAQVQQQAEADQPSPGKHLWSLADESFRERVTSGFPAEMEPTAARQKVVDLVEDLNELLQRPDFYDREAWQGVPVNRRLRELLADDPNALTEDELRARNRLLLKAAFPGVVADVADQELQVSYFGWTLGGTIPVSRSMAEPIINQLLAAVMDFFVGTLGVFVAILVTASIIPHMFEEGAIDLLLSKPVNRSLLFLVKFFGGCAFILLNAGYFILGLWLIMGLRFGIWNHALPLCIPLFLFLFVIYYSISALAGVVWKNATVAIVVTIVFWACCFTIGTTKAVLDNAILGPGRLVTLVPTPGTVLAVTQSQEIVEWQDDHWEPVIAGSGGRGSFMSGGLMIGPLYNDDRDELAYLMPTSQSRRFQFMNTPTFVIAEREGGLWQPDEQPDPPVGTSWMFRGPDQSLLFMNHSGLFRFEPAGGRSTGLIGLALGLANESPFVPVGPDPPLALKPGFTAAMNPDTGDVVVYDDGTLLVLNRNGEGQYVRGASATLEGIEGSVGLAFARDRVAAARPDGVVSLFDAQSLNEVHALQIRGRSEPYVVTASPSGDHFAVLYHDGRLVTIDADGSAWKTIDRDASAVAFDRDGQMLVADQYQRVATYRGAEGDVTNRIAPPLDTLTIVYRFVVVPLYTVFPKPGELGNVVSYFLTGEQSVVVSPDASDDLRQARRVIDVQGPILSSLLFAAVVLAFTCWYIERSDI